MNNQLKRCSTSTPSNWPWITPLTDIYPNERLMPSPPFPEFKLYSVEGAHPPAAARGDKGEDVLPLLTSLDRRYPEDFDKLPFKGYAREHTLTLDLGKLSPSKRAVLLMTAGRLCRLDSQRGRRSSGRAAHATLFAGAKSEWSVADGHPQMASGRAPEDDGGRFDGQVSV
jgi:hypothetical protein